MSKQIAISVTKSNGSDSLVDQRFGRAFGFLIINADTKEIVTFVKNNSVDAAHGAGTGAAALMAANNVATIISGRFGPKAHQALAQMKIEMMMAKEGTTVTEALDKLESGDLEKMELKVY